MKQKKILILGATISQIPLIKIAKEFGYFVIVCTYDATEPGIGYADEFHNISTTDNQAVLNLARTKNVDAVTSWATDVAAPAAAYASEVLGLPGNPYQSVKMLTEKDSFREFLIKRGFLTPGYQVLSEEEIQLSSELSISLPVIVKPVDSSGGRGVARVSDMANYMPALHEALLYSRKKRVIVEEAIEMKGAQIHGDGFVVDGRLVFTFLGDHHFSGVSNVVPVATSWPSQMPDYILRKLSSEVGRLIQESGFQYGPVNIEARIDPDQNIYIIELAPRAGGHSSSELTNRGTGVDLLFEMMQYLDGQKIKIKKTRSECVAYYLIHSRVDGLFSDINIDPEIKRHITSLHLKIGKGEQVRKYQNMRDALGLVLFGFENNDAMMQTLNNVYKSVSVVLE